MSPPAVRFSAKPQHALGLEIERARDLIVEHPVRTKRQHARQREALLFADRQAGCCVIVGKPVIKTMNTVA
jgi:hypothetical protein